MLSIEQIASVCHEANRAYCLTLGDSSQLPWADAPEWQKDSAISGVRFHLDNPGSRPSRSHEEWLKIKVADGWVYGERKNLGMKTHPCVVPYDELPEEQKAKDVLFIAVVNALGAA